MSAKHSRKITAASYRERSYRQMIDAAGLTSFEVRVRETDLHILASRDFSAEALQAVLRYRGQLEGYLTRNRQFLTTFQPLPPDPLAPPLVKAMLSAAEKAGVGPMAAVAGTIAEFVGRELLGFGVEEIMVENGGDIFLTRRKSCTLSIFAGASPLSHKVGLRLPAERMPLGICTSSGTVGHSVSLGRADSVTVLAGSTPLADAAATRLGNEVRTDRDIERALEQAQTIPGLGGVVIIRGRRLGAWGEVDLVSLG